MTKEKVKVGEIVVTLYEDDSILMSCENIRMKKVISILANAILLFEKEDKND